MEECAEVADQNQIRAHSDSLENQQNNAEAGQLMRLVLAGLFFA
jgi:hypothetical protein